MNKFFQYLRRIFQQSEEPSANDLSPTNGSAQGDETNLVKDEIALTKLLELIEHTRANAYSCQETLDLLDEYTELAVANQDVAMIMPLVKNHISDCPDCTERYEALVQILQNP